MMTLKWPSELEFLEFFLVEPEKQDTVYSYDVTDSRGVNLIFSFDVMTDSIQTVLKIKGSEIAIIVIEGLEKILIDNTNRDKPFLRAEFFNKNIVKLNLAVQPDIKVNWSGLID